MVKRGFSLIELILSIVVVAVVSISIPLVLKTTSELNQKALTQESLMNAKTYMGLILKAPFSDKIVKATQDGHSVYFYPIVLEPGDTRNEFYRVNKLGGDGHRGFAYTNSSELSTDNSPYNPVKSVNFYEIKNKNLQTANQNRDYIVGSSYKVSVKEGGGDFKPNFALKNKDVKEIIVTSTSYKDGGKSSTTSVLKAYAFNLGESGSLNTKEWK